MSGYQGHYGDRRRSGWGTGDTAEYAIGDVVWCPMSERLDTEGVYRVTACFSIAEAAEFYYRVSPMEFTGRGDRCRTRWEIVSDRLHAIPGGLDFTEGWVLLHRAVEKP